jgi:lysophospholipase L1-like esterase
MSSSGVTLHNVAAFIKHPHERRDVFSRLPVAVRAAVNAGCQEKCLEAAGVEIRCNVEGRGGGVRVFVAGRQAVRAELYLGDFLAWPMLIGPGEQEIPLAGRIGWPWLKGQGAEGTSEALLRQVPARRFDPGLRRILFSFRASVGPVRTRGEVFPARAEQLPRRTLLCYGSSITQGMESLTAAGGYAPRLARLLGMDLINLGFGGSAHLEPEMAAHIAQRNDWHAAVLELGINLVGTMEPEVFAGRARAFVAAVAAAGRPVFCLDLFRYFDDFPGGDAGRARAFRQAVAEAAAAAGPQVRSIAVGELPGPDGLCADLLHPSPEGMETIARVLAEQLRPEVRP